MRLNVEKIVKANWKVFLNRNKNIKFEDYGKCLDGEDYQKECDKNIIRSNIHGMYHQEVKKSTLSVFDDERCYENII